MNQKRIAQRQGMKAEKSARGDWKGDLEKKWNQPETQSPDTQQYK